MTFLAKEIPLLAISLFSLVLVGMQVVMTRRHGWRGLAGGTGIAIAAIFTAAAIVKTRLPLPRAVDEFGIYGELFFLAIVLFDFFLVLIAATLLPFTLKTE